MDGQRTSVSLSEKGWQDELSPAESDELYRYRLRRLALRERRLETAVAGGTEEEPRDALADYRATSAHRRSSAARPAFQPATSPTTSSSGQSSASSSSRSGDRGA